VAFLVKTEKTRDIYAHDIVQGLFPNKAKDFIIILDDDNIVLIKELKSMEDTKEIEKTAKIIIDSLGAELMVKAFIGIGTVVDNIKDLARSFKEAQMALLIGRIFESDKAIINYNRLGIGRLIYQIPTTLCELFLNEVFKNNTFESLDAETMLTIQKFFENHLNVSETSRQLYVHRNTLVYRLDKIKKLTGLDLTSFDDAVIFKVAILVKKYLDKNQNML
jgi:carbohydrate diacid regulator